MEYLDKETLDKIISEYENEIIEYHKKWIEKTKNKIIQELNLIFRKSVNGKESMPPFNPEWIDFQPFGCVDHEGNIVRSKKMIESDRTFLSVLRLNIPGLSQIHTTARIKVDNNENQDTQDFRFVVKFIDKWTVVFDNGKKQCDTLLEALSVARRNNENHNK